MIIIIVLYVLQLLFTVHESFEGLRKTILQRYCFVRNNRRDDRYMRDLKARKRYAQIYDNWRRQATDEYLETNSDADVRRNRSGLRDVSMPDKLLRLAKSERTVLNEMYGFATKTRGADCALNGVRFVGDDCASRDTTAVAVGSETRFAMEKEVFV